MINMYEVSETNKMIEQENLDVRTITLGISLLDCIDSNLDELNRKIYEKITTVAKDLVSTGQDIEKEFGSIYMEERDYKFTQEKKEEIHQLIMVDKKLPDLPFAVDKISYLDGCKVYFENGGWVVCRFSGTEPLLRIFCEMANPKEAEEVCVIFEKYLNLTWKRP